jgi:carboxypeptidase Taq
MATNFERLKQAQYDVNALGAAMSMMDWDQQCLMPPGGAEARAEHVGILSRMRHELATSAEMGELIAKSEGEIESDEDRAYLRVSKRDYDLATKFPTTLVEEKTKLSSKAHEDWVHARADNNFKGFADTLQKMVDLSIQEAECIGYTDHIYTALLDMYEEGATKADCDRMFGALRSPAVQLVKDIQNSDVQPDDSFLYGEWSETDQSKFTEMLVTAIGFDMNRGRQDTAPHPFCTGWSVGDIRLTTRYKPYLGSAIFGSLHEAGHGMYEQGSPMAWDRTPLAGGVSLGLHESQSRTWENIVGRSRAFWTRFLPDLKAAFPNVGILDLDTFYPAINKVEPTLIRVEADEVTYNLHIMVRFEIECAMLTGELKVKDLPDAWNAKYEEYLGITPDSDANGCLQDVHWSMGSLGYFPTYSMGNLLSYQLWNVLTKDVGDVEGMMAEGNFAPIHAWLQDKIYSKGRYYTPKQLIQDVTGKPMGAEDYIEGIQAKYRAIYKL